MSNKTICLSEGTEIKMQSIIYGFFYKMLEEDIHVEIEENNGINYIFKYRGWTCAFPVDRCYEEDGIIFGPVEAI